MEINKWIMSILVITIINLSVDLILNNNSISKFIKVIFSLATMLIIIYPITNIFNQNANFNFDFELNVDSDFIEYSVKEQIVMCEKRIVEQLKEKGYSNIDVEIEYKMSEYNYEIIGVNVNLSKMVINPNVAHINKYTEIKEIVVSITGVQEKNIVFYE